MGAISNTPAKKKVEVNILDNGQPQTISMKRASDGALIKVNYTEEDIAPFKALGFAAISPDEQAVLDIAQAKTVETKKAEAEAAAAQDAADAADTKAMLKESLAAYRAKRAAAAAKATAPA